MPTLHLLGTGAALASADRTTTMIAFEGDTAVVVDCGGDVVHRLLCAGIDLDRIELMILTHQHQDHVGGFPLFMEKIWLAERRRPIAVAGPAAALEQARKIHEAFDTSSWAGMPDIEWREIALAENAAVPSNAEWRITAAPGRHSVPVIGVRVQHVASGGVVAYSSDTQRSEAIVRLARDVDILVHEGTGEFPGHIPASEAARIARESSARQLVLVHIPPDLDQVDLEQASSIFPALEVGVDGGRYTF